MTQEEKEWQDWYDYPTLWEGKYLDVVWYVEREAIARFEGWSSTGRTRLKGDPKIRTTSGYDEWLQLNLTEALALQTELAHAIRLVQELQDVMG